MGFEPTRAENIALAVHRLNYTAPSSVDNLQVSVIKPCIKLVLEPYVQPVVTV